MNLMTHGLGSQINNALQTASRRMAVGPRVTWREAHRALQLLAQLFNIDVIHDIKRFLENHIQQERWGMGVNDIQEDFLEAMAVAPTENFAMSNTVKAQHDLFVMRFEHDKADFASLQAHSDFHKHFLETVTEMNRPEIYRQVAEALRIKAVACGMEHPVIGNNNFSGPAEDLLLDLLAFNCMLHYPRQAFATKHPAARQSMERVVTIGGTLNAILRVCGLGSMLCFINKSQDVL